MSAVRVIYFRFFFCLSCVRSVCERDIQIDIAPESGRCCCCCCPSSLFSLSLSLPFRSIALLCIYSNVILLGTQKTNTQTHNNTKTHSGWLSKSISFSFLFCYSFLLSFNFRNWMMSRLYFCLGRSLSLLYPAQLESFCFICCRLFLWWLPILVVV